MSIKPNEPVSLRSEAEARLNRRPLNLVQPQPGEALLHELLHELRVHQIELQMQNDELRRTQADLEKSRDRYIDLYEFAPVGYLTLTHEGIISEANIRASKLLRTERNMLLGHRFSGFISAEDCDRWHLYFHNLMQHDMPSYELALKHDNGTIFHVLLDCKKSNLDNEPSIRVALTDITELRSVNSRLKA